MKEFKVGDKVCTTANGDGFVENTLKGDFFPITVRFRGRTDWFTSDGKHLDDDLNPTLFHGHHTTFTTEPEPEPVYEYQWLIRHNSGECLFTTRYYKTEKEARAEYSADVAFLERLDRYKRELKESQNG